MYREDAPTQRVTELSPSSLTAALSARPGFDPTLTPREGEIVNPGPFHGP